MGQPILILRMHHQQPQTMGMTRSLMDLMLLLMIHVTFTRGVTPVVNGQKMEVRVKVGIAAMVWNALSIKETATTVKLLPDVMQVQCGTMEVTCGSAPHKVPPIQSSRRRKLE